MNPHEQALLAERVRRFLASDPARTDEARYLVQRLWAELGLQKSEDGNPNMYGVAEWRNKEP